MSVSFVISILLAIVLNARSQEIVDYDGSTLIVSNATPKDVLTIEWANSPTNTWRRDWEGLREVDVTGTYTRLEAPMFFRVTRQQSELEWLTISKPNNEPDTTGFGAVSYNFKISKFEITNKQYADFLNTVDPTGTNKYGLFRTESDNDVRAGIKRVMTTNEGSRYTIKANMTNKPVVYVSFWSACRYCNWLHNGPTVTNTETGAYNLSQAINPTNKRILRSPNARFFIPNEDEWYKAAYYNSSTATSNYFLYPTSTSARPATANATGTNPPGDLINYDHTNVANYALGADWNGVDGNVTTVGAAVNSFSPWGAYDMGGNVSEWVEANYSDSNRLVRGGSWLSQEETLRSTARNGYTPVTALNSLGFRIAAPVY